jgi:hypothetical protein
MTHFPQQRDRLQPPETFFDVLPLLLADGIARVARGTRIDGALASALIVFIGTDGTSSSCSMNLKLLNRVFRLPRTCIKAG